MKKKPNYEKQLEKRNEELEKIIDSLRKERVTRDELAMLIVKRYMSQGDPDIMSASTAMPISIYLMFKFNPWKVADAIIDGKSFEEFMKP